MSVVYDLILVAVFAFVVWRGWRRGFLATLLWLAGWGVALFIIAGWGGIWTERIYTNQVEPWVVSSVEKVIPAGTEASMNSGADAVESIQGILDSLDGPLGGQRVTASAAASISGALRQNSTDLAEGIARSVLRPALISVLKGIVFAAILFVVMFVFRLLSRRAARRQGSHGVLSKANRLLGILLGGLEGMAVAYVLVFALNIAANFLELDWLTPKILSESFLVSRMM